MKTSDINAAILEYQASWRNVTAATTEKDFFEAMKPTAVGWKTLDLAEFDHMLESLRDACDQIHIAWINERWMATLHLKETTLEWGIGIIKLMQRRPGSEDAVGLDHVDFLLPDMAEAEAVLGNETNLTWTKETDNPHCSWISVWFSGTEAKLRDTTVLDVCIAELKDANRQIIDGA